MGDTTRRVYNSIYDEEDSADTEIIQNFIMHGLGLCIKANSYLAHTFYTWSFSHNTEFLMATKKKKILPFLEYTHHCICLVIW